MSAAPKLEHDLGKERGLSLETLTAFNVRVNGTGWLYDSKCIDNSVIKRRKSFYSTREDAPEAEQVNWSKYSWPDGKPDVARYFYPPKLSLTKALDEAWNTLWIVGGDIAHMSLISAGIHNSLSFFGDKIPQNLMNDLESWGVTCLRIIPDRDESGEKWAIELRDLIVNSLDYKPNVVFHALPYPIENKHGFDVNNYWLDNHCDHETFLDKLLALPLWVLPQPLPKTQPLNLSENDTAIPASLKTDLRIHLGLQTDQFNSEGWARKNVICPFHNEKVPSATWNDESGTLFCHRCDKTYLAKDLCAHFGLRMADYFEKSPTLETKPNLKIETVKEPIIEIVPKPIAPSEIHYQYAPPLPEGVALTEEQLKEAIKGRKWLDDYVTWAKKAGPLSPEIFYEALALWTVSMAATRRMKVTIGAENIFPNLYVFIVATTTIFHKSTALHMANMIIEKSNLEFLKMPERATPEAMFEYLAGRTPANFDEMAKIDAEQWAMGRTFASQRAIMEDEASGLLSEMKKDYMSGLSELLLKGYDGQGTLKKLLKSQGQITVRDMCLSFLGATTPVEWSRRMTYEERQNGFVARFAIITPESSPIYQEVDEEIPPPQSVIYRLRYLFTKLLPWDKKLMGTDGNPHPLPKGESISTPPITNIEISIEAMSQIKKYRKAMVYDMHKDVGGLIDEDKAPSYGRLGTMLIKVAMLLAAIETEALPIRIEARHAYAAQQICERWRESLHRLDEHIIACKRTNADEKLLQFVKTSGEVGVTARDIQRAFHMEPSQRDQNLKLLMDAGLIEMFKRDTKGRPAICYRVLQDKVY